MIYHHVYRRFGTKQRVRAAVIGAGHFGTAVVTQQKYNAALDVVIVADKNRELARSALVKAEIPEDRIVFSGDAGAAAKAIAAGEYVYTDEADLIMDVPAIDALCEGTGVPEAGARFAKRAIERRKHVVMINKETDSVVGPILRKLAHDAGVVYTPVDGDQHGLLMAMVEWARVVGLTVITAGKARDGEYVWDEAAGTVSIAADGITVHEDHVVEIPRPEASYLQMIPEGRAQEYVARRAELLKDLPGAGAFDLCEMTIAANATGLSPEHAPLRQGSLRITELPIAYCSKRNGGIFEGEGVIDVMTCFRRPDEAGMGGGVFLVVRCDNAYSNYILTTKGQIPNYARSTAVIYRPYHLCGVETSTSILCAGLLGIDTGSRDYRPRFDLVKVAARDIRAGETFGNDHDQKLTAEIRPAQRLANSHALPGHMLDGNTAAVDIPKGTLITAGMVRAPANSVLWDLRALQDRTFAV